MQQPSSIGLTQGMKTRLAGAVPAIRQYKERIVKKDLLRIRLANAVFVILAAVAIIPVKAGYLGKINHGCILS